MSISSDTQGFVDSIQSQIFSVSVCVCVCVCVRVCVYVCKRRRSFKMFSSTRQFLALFTLSHFSHTHTHTHTHTHKHTHTHTHTHAHIRTMRQRTHRDTQFVKICLTSLK